MTAPTLAKVVEVPSHTPLGGLRRSLQLEAELANARQGGAQVLLTGSAVHDLFVDPVGRALWLPDLVRSYCERNDVGLVVYRLGAGVVSQPILPNGEAVPVRAVDPQAHPANAVIQVLEDVRQFARPAVFLFDFADSLLPISEGPLTLELSLLAEQLQSLTADVLGWHRPGLQLVMIDRGVGVHQRLAHQPGIHTIEVNAPDATESTAFLDRVTTAKSTSRLFLADSLSVAEAGRLAGGLLLRDLNELRIASAFEHITAAQLADLKGRAIREQSNGTLVLLDGAVDFATDVAGMHALRLYLRKLALLGQRTARIVLAGPPGTGKTYSAQAIARLLGVPLVSFGQILGELLGQAETNMRRALATLEAMAPVAIFIDEADKRELGSRTADGRTSNEAYGALEAMLYEFLGDPGDDNGISVIATTNVPGRLDARAQSRFTFLPVLFASGTDLVEIMTIQARRSSVAIEGDLGAVLIPYTESGKVLSGRSAQRVLSEAHVRARRSGVEAVQPEHVAQALRSRIKNDYTPAAEYSTLTSLIYPDDSESLPWVAADVLGEAYPLPAYLRRYWRDGSLDVDAAEHRVRELEHLPGVY